jgi:hypothetical protein
LSRHWSNSSMYLFVMGLHQNDGAHQSRLWLKMILQILGLNGYEWSISSKLTTT